MSGLGKARCVALSGVQGHLVEVEANIGAGLPKTVLLGLPDAALTEARDRCRAAVVNSGLTWPNRLLTIALSPASLPKAGAHYDLAIAIAVLEAAGEVPAGGPERTIALGELALDGRLRAVPGVLPATLAAAHAGIDTVVVPEANAAEAALVTGMTVLGARSLAQVVALLRGEPFPEAPPVPPLAGDAGLAWRREPPGDALDLADVVGQHEARRAIEVAAAGGHHVLLDGPPGSGKTMLAERLPGLLPDLEEDEALEVTAVHSVAGVLPPDVPLVTRPPYVDPHHTASAVSVVGGGSRMIRPGSISLAHRGVLFLDEAPEFRSDVLEALRQPLEGGDIVIGRAERTSRFPARFLLVMAANPCPCGHSFGKGAGCQCPPAARRRYRDRISGPIRDRIDLHRTVLPVTPAQMRADLCHVEASRDVAERVRSARHRQRRRLAGTPWRRNCEVPGPVLRRSYPPASGAMDQIDALLREGRLTARGADRVLRIGWTLADLAGIERPGRLQVAEAVMLRTSGVLPRAGSARALDAADSARARSVGRAS